MVAASSLGKRLYVMGNSRLSPTGRLGLLLVYRTKWSMRCVFVLSCLSLIVVWWPVCCISIHIVGVRRFCSLCSWACMLADEKIPKISRLTMWGRGRIVV